MFRISSQNNSFHFIKSYLIGSSVIESSSPSRLMIGHLLGDFQFSAIAQVFGDPGGAETVAPDTSTDAGGLGASARHPEDVGLGHGRV